MKRKHLLKSMLLLCALMVGTNVAWATETVFKTLIFSSNDATKVSGYEDSWTETIGDDSWTVTNFNNNNWGWNATTEGASKLIKCGRKRTGKSGSYVYTPSIATISSKFAMSKAISKVVVTTEAIDKDDINSIKLYVASDASFETITETVNATIPNSAGDITFEVETPTANRYYKVEFDTKGQKSSNGHTSVSKIVYYYEDIPAYTITASANDALMGSVEVSGSVITALPITGCRVKSGDAGYTITSGTATVVNNGDNTFTVTPSTNCTITINFEDIPMYEVSWSVNGSVIDREDIFEGESIVFNAPSSGVPSGYTFVGWSDSEIITPQVSAPEYVSSATCSADVTYYAVLAVAKEGDPESTLTQTLKYGEATWNIGGSYTNKSTYTLFHDGGYVESSAFDLSKLDKVKVYGGTFGGSSTYKTFTIGDGTNVWKAGELSGTNNAKEHEFVDGTPLTGNGKLYVTSTCGKTDGSGSGIRVSKVEIYTLEPTYTYNTFCTSVPTPASITITSAGWASFSNANELAIPAGVTAYYAQKKDGSNVTLKEITSGYIPANTGVVLSGAADTYSANVTATGATLGAENILYPWLTAGEPTEPTYYTLAVSGGKPIFKKSSGGTLAAGKAYLVMPAGSAELTVDFDDENGGDVVTGIDTIEHSTLNIEHSEVYNLNGQRVSQPTKGLYIVNGKKVVVK